MRHSLFVALALPLFALAPLALAAGCSGSTTGTGGNGDGGTNGEGGPTGDHPINAADYDQSCTTSEDCTAAVTGDTCAYCNCPNDAVASSAKSKYDADYEALHALCPKQTIGVSCAACAPVATICQAKKCVLQKCTNGTLDAHSCIGETDAGADATGE